MASDRRARKRERRARGADDRYWEEELPAYLRTRIVCDRCGLDQPFRANVWEGNSHELAPCEGTLGLVCASQTAVFLDDWEYWSGR